jgi:hypothetical protein
LLGQNLATVDDSGRLRPTDRAITLARSSFIEIHE